MLLPFKPLGHFLFSNKSNKTMVFLGLVELMDLFRATKVSIPQHGSCGSRTNGMSTSQSVTFLVSTQTEHENLF